MNPIGYDDIVASFYEAASGVGTWRSALDLVVDAVQARSVMLAGFGLPGRELEFAHAAGPVPAQFFVDYMAYWHAHNPRLGSWTDMPPGEWMHCHEHFDEAFVRASAFYQQFLIPYDARFTSVTKIRETADRMIVMIINRTVDAGPLGAAEVYALDRLRAHLARAFSLYRPVSGPERASLVGRQLVEGLGHPTWVIDASRRILFRNRAADQTVRRGELMVESDDQLYAVSGSDDRRLGQVLASHGKTGGARPRRTRVIRLRDGRGGPPLPLFVTRLDRDATFYRWSDAPALMLTLYDRDGVALPDVDAVATAFLLTPAESRIAVSLAAGLTVEQIAQEHSVAVATVRSQVKSLFAKTGASRQSDVVRLVHGLPGAVALTAASPLAGGKGLPAA